jgi:transcriptional regulator with GAF, ATPase, and Fis domain
MGTVNSWERVLMSREHSNKSTSESVTSSSNPSSARKACRGLKKPKRQPRVPTVGSPPLRAGDHVTERELVLSHTVKVLERCNSVAEAAQILGVSERTIRRRIEQYDLEFIRYPLRRPLARRRFELDDAWNGRD